QMKCLREYGSCWPWILPKCATPAFSSQADGFAGFAARRTQASHVAPRPPIAHFLVISAVSTCRTITEPLVSFIPMLALRRSRRYTAVMLSFLLALVVGEPLRAHDCAMHLGAVRSASVTGGQHVSGGHEHHAGAGLTQD